jgi:DNA recombination protein Rad52
MLTDEQKTLLGKSLSPGRIKQRSQGGRNVSYLEGWDAIGVANQIFDYDGWSSEVTSLHWIATDEHKGSNGKVGWQTAYYATVKVHVGDEFHEDSGFGNDISYASAITSHELALKEAVTDALKRALRHWGDQFGLCLYDKEQRGVGTEEGQPIAKGAVDKEPIKREAQASSPLQGKKEPPATPADLEASSDEEVMAYYAYLTEHDVDAKVVGKQIEDAKKKYHGIIPKPWLDHMFTQARLKFGDKLNGDEDV